jgi:hypothetical protein
MGLSAPRPALEKQPTVELFCVVPGLVVSHLDRIGLPLANTRPAALLEAIKCQRSQFVKVAESEETIARAAGYLPLPTRANEDLTEIGMTDGHIPAQVAYAVAMWAIRIAESLDAGISRG